MHNVRVWDLEKRARDLAEGLVTFQAKQVPSRGQLRDAFEASGAAFETFLSELQAGAPKRRPSLPSKRAERRWTGR